MDRFLRALVKGGLKSLVPVVGPFAVEVADATSAAFFDERERGRASDIAGRLVRHMRQDAEAWLPREGIGDDDIDALTATAEALGGGAGTLVLRWSDAAFDPEAAADMCLARNAPLIAGLSDSQQLLCRVLLVSMFRNLADERKALEATEAGFRRSVLQGLDRLADRLTGLSAIEQQRVSATVAVAAFAVATIAWRPGISPPGALLRADIDDPVPFHGRTRELEDLLVWCDTASNLGVRVYTGAGGIGKTRLMREAIERLRQRGWRSGFLDPRVPAESVDVWAAVAASREPSFHVVDYAETRRPAITRLLAALLTGLDVRRRVVFLARAADDWWDHLRGQRDGVAELLQGPAARAIRLGPLTSSLEERQASFEAAAAHFAAKLGRAPVPTSAVGLDNPIYERALLLHMSALAAIDGVTATGDQGVLDYVLARERRFWADVAAAGGLPASLHRGLGRAMAAVTLAGGCDDRASAVALITRIPFFADQPVAVREAIAHLLHDSYPGERWIEPMLPDLLGEHLVQVELEDDPDGLLGLVLDAPSP